MFKYESINNLLKKDKCEDFIAVQKKNLSFTVSE